MTATRYTTRRGFTLVELLVVIGIIAVLIGILLPALNRARESSRRVKCLSNIRQISMAFFMYTGENNGWFPSVAVFGGGLGYPNTTGHPEMTPTWVGWPEDWVVWRQKQPGDPLEGAIFKYMGNPSPEVMQCPSDDPIQRAIDGGSEGTYPYSYVMNSYLSYGTVYNPRVAGIKSSPATSDGYNNFIPAYRRTGYAWKISQVRHSSDKVIVYEEDERVMRDGRGQMQSPAVGSNPNNIIGMLSIRHDGTKRTPDDPPPVGGGKIEVNVNVDKKGNVGYVDGHGDYITRREAHDATHYVPTL
jgi:prepilin-type N-terminal cleavage/methylation domain-containing protein/prepilin-type processing-associated H-X9-DG protein